MPYLQVHKPQWPYGYVIKTLLQVISIFIYGVFDDAVSISDYTASSGRMIDECLIVKNLKGSGHGQMQVLYTVT
jgi:hypothetical protein